MKVFHSNIEQDTKDNTNYRTVVYTTERLQIVYMNIKPLDNIHKEIHKDHDQFIRIESGRGIAIIEGNTYELYDGIGLVIPAGFEHEIINSSIDEEMKLYTIYTPPEHKSNTINEENPDI